MVSPEVVRKTIDDYRTPKHKPQEVGSRTRLESRIGSDVRSFFTAGRIYLFFTLFLLTV